MSIGLTLVPASTTTYEYDYENRLVKITYPDNGRSEFVYDAIGRLLGGIEKNAQGQVISARQYIYDGLDMIAELDGGGSLVAAYTHGPGIDDPLLVRYNNANYFFHKNHQGSVTDITASNQSTVKTYKYDAYGNILQETGPTVPGGITYTGRQYHSRSGLYYYRARWYSPQLGRFLTQDPIGHLGGTNLYAYALNNPVNWFDPLGLLTYVVADDVTPWVSGNDILRFSDKDSFADAIANIPKGETEIVVIAHGEKEAGAAIEPSGGSIKGKYLLNPFIKNRSNFSENVLIDFRVCYLFKGEAGQAIKCELMRTFPEGTISGSSGRINYLLGTIGLWASGFGFAASSPAAMMGW